MLVATILSSAWTWIIIFIAMFFIVIFLTIDYCEKTQRKNFHTLDDQDKDDEEDEDIDEDLEEDEDYEEDDSDDEWDEESLADAILTTLALHHSFKKKDKKKKNRNEWWETHCEFCGEPLEDCQCEHKHESRRDAGL